jgi:hypothetical protein
MRFFIKASRFTSDEDIDEMEVEELERFQIIEASTIETIQEAFENDEKNNDFMLEYAIEYHPVFPRLLEEFGEGPLDGSIRFLMGLDVPAEPALIVHMVFAGVALAKQGIDEEELEVAAEYVKESEEMSDMEFSGSMHISDRGNFSVN